MTNKIFERLIAESTETLTGWHEIFGNQTTRHLDRWLFAKKLVDHCCQEFEKATESCYDAHQVRECAERLRQEFFIENSKNT
jgi:hypothetical protein